MSELLIIGFGYSAAAIAAECRPDMHVRATIRGEANIAKVEAAGGVIEQAIFDFPGGRRFHFIEPGGSELAVWSATAT